MRLATQKQHRCATNSRDTDTKHCKSAYRTATAQIQRVPIIKTKKSLNDSRAPFLILRANELSFIYSYIPGINQIKVKILRQHPQLLFGLIA